MVTHERCTCCRWLYRLPGECLVISATFVHVIMSTVELLIHLNIIISGKDQSHTTTTKPISTSSPQDNVTSSSTTDPHDPGGTCQVDLPSDLDMTVTIIRYATLVISGLFFIEIIGRVTYAKLRFFKDPWQVLDACIVLISLAAEIALFIMHRELICTHVATEAVAFIIIFRLLKIPRACDIRKKEYKQRMQDQIYYLTLTKTSKEEEFKQLEIMYQNQTKELLNLKTSLKHTSSGVQPNANGEFTPIHNGIAAAVNRIYSHGEDEVDSLNNKNDLERNDSDKSEKSDKTSKGHDSGIEEKDSFRSDSNDIRRNSSSNKATGPKGPKKPVRSRKSAAEVVENEVCDSDGSEVPVKAQEVRVQIAEPSRQKKLPSRSDSALGGTEPVQMRRKSSFEGTFFVNRAYNEDEDVDEVDLNESRTYKSAEGIPMTDL